MFVFKDRKDSGLPADIDSVSFLIYYVLRFVLVRCGMFIDFVICVDLGGYFLWFFNSFAGYLYLYFVLWCSFSYLYTLVICFGIYI